AEQGVHLFKPLRPDDALDLGHGGISWLECTKNKRPGQFDRAFGDGAAYCAGVAGMINVAGTLERIQTLSHGWRIASLVGSGSYWEPPVLGRRYALGRSSPCASASGTLIVTPPDWYCASPRRTGKTYGSPSWFHSGDSGIV